MVGTNFKQAKNYRVWKMIDRWLNSVTMYRLTLGYLSLLWLAAFVLSVLNVLPLPPLSLVLSLITILGISRFSNWVFSKLFKVYVNVESADITTLILVLSLTPLSSLSDGIFISLTALVAQMSKYIFVINKRHIFNPAATALVLAPFISGRGASWWIGVEIMSPLVIIGGLILVRKIRRFDLVITFLTSALITMFVFGWRDEQDILKIFTRSMTNSPLLFMAFVMIVEPLTTPSKHLVRTVYGIAAGILFAPQLSLGNLYSSPELAIAISNVLSYILNPLKRYVFKLKSINEIGPRIYEYVFESSQKLNFIPGQYLEWTLEDTGSDNRGNRRFFTIASSPTERNIKLGIKHGSPPSTFKNNLLSLGFGEKIYAGQLSGEFTLPDKSNKSVFIAGGIGITPFRSMIKYLIDKGESRDVVLFYSVTSTEELIYKDVFERARKKLNIPTYYYVSKLTGRLNKHELMTKVKDFSERNFYLSGPRSMVEHFELLLAEIGIPKVRILTDYFPGF